MWPETLKLMPRLVSWTVHPCLYMNTVLRFTNGWSLVDCFQLLALIEDPKFKPLYMLQA